MDNKTPIIYSDTIDITKYYIKSDNIITSDKSLDDNIIQNIEKTKQYIIDYLLPIVYKSMEGTNDVFEGNIFTINGSYFTDMYLNKQKNISRLVMNENIQNVMEIGFNSGFSALLMLISNPNIRLTCFDIGEHTYTLPCYQKLKETFGERINILIGDSRNTLPIINTKYDLIHIDGGHTYDVASSDIENSYRLSKEGTFLIMDDYDCNQIQQIWDDYTIKYNLKQYNEFYYTPQQSVKIV